jgi:hypothetical protein
MFSSAWNDFQGSGVIGDRFWLDYGNHMLTLRVTQADNFGVELDTIELDIGNNTLTTSFEYTILLICISIGE